MIVAAPANDVEVRGLVKRFRPPLRLGALLRGRPRAADVVALSGLDLKVRQGELVGLAGPHGAGKSTLLRLIAGLLLPDSGEVRTSGAVGYAVAEERSHFWRLSGRENLRFFASLHGLIGSQRDARVAEALGVLELEDAADRIVREYSTGMRQRLAIARGLLGAPQVLLLDEPTRSLDPRSAGRLRRFVKDELCGRRGSTVLYATHQIDELRDFCPRVVLLDRGRVAGDGAWASLGAAIAEVLA